MRLGWALVLVLFAGCFESAGSSGTAGPVSGATSGSHLAPTTAAAPAPDDTTGAIVVLVSTPEIEPVAAASVSLQGVELTAFTDAAGQATFNRLDPGTYTVLVAKPGYKSSAEKGRLVDVVANEAVEVKLTLTPEVILDASNVYHRSLNFVGHMSCSVQFGPPTTLGYTTYCSRGASVGGQSVRDPNDNSSHQWDVENIQIQSILVEARWQQSNGANSRALMIGTYVAFSCTDPGNAGALRTCTPSNAIAERAGPSPAYVLANEGPDQNITKRRLSTDPTKYPMRVRTEVRAACDGCTGAAFVLQQKYDAWATAFYGAPAPPGWSIYPPA